MRMRTNIVPLLQKVNKVSTNCKQKILKSFSNSKTRPRHNYPCDGEWQNATQEDCNLSNPWFIFQDNCPKYFCVTDLQGNVGQTKILN